MFPKWQPICTAPKDGTRILIFEAKEGTAGTVRVSCWRNDTIPSGWAGSEHTPSHWLPLPHPPNKESADVALPFTEEQLKAIRGVLTARGGSLEADQGEFLEEVGEADDRSYPVASYRDG